MGVSSVSGTRTEISFSISGVSTMKMMSSTSTMSTSGVMLMSERGPFDVPTAAPMESGPHLFLICSAARATPFSLALEARSRTGLIFA